MTTVNNYINGQIVPPTSNQYLDILNPATSTSIGKVALSTSADANAAVLAAQAAYPKWSSMTVKARGRSCSKSTHWFNPTRRNWHS